LPSRTSPVRRQERARSVRKAAGPIYQQGARSFPFERSARRARKSSEPARHRAGRRPYTWETGRMVRRAPQDKDIR
jgi:hypothetical protein